MAIKLFLLWIVENSNTINRHKQISHFSATHFSVLKAIKPRKKPTAGQIMLNGIYKLVSIINQNVTLVWIPKTKVRLYQALVRSVLL